MWPGISRNRKTPKSWKSWKSCRDNRSRSRIGSEAAYKRGPQQQWPAIYRVRGLDLCCYFCDVLHCCFLICCWDKFSLCPLHPLCPWACARATTPGGRGCGRGGSGGDDSEGGGAGGGSCPWQRQGLAPLRWPGGAKTPQATHSSNGVFLDNLVGLGLL